MAMVRVGQVRMLVHEQRVLMRVRVRPAQPFLVDMLMVRIMFVSVLVLQPLMRMPMSVARPNHRHDADPH